MLRKRLGTINLNSDGVSQLSDAFTVLRGAAKLSQELACGWLSMCFSVHMVLLTVFVLQKDKND